MTPEQAVTIFQFLLPQIENETKTTRKVLAAVPNDKGQYSPADKCMNCLRLVSHIAHTDVWFLQGIAKGEFASEPSDDFNSPADALAYYDAEIPKGIEAIKKLSPEELVKPVQFYVWTNPNVVYAQFLINHMIHHRGQLSAYLRPMGAKVPSIYGGSADEPFEVAAAQA